jgi:acetyl esterase/lipase
MPCPNARFLAGGLVIRKRSGSSKRRGSRLAAARIQRFWLARLSRRPLRNRSCAAGRGAGPAELAGLPPTFVSVGTADCLRDEAIDFTARLCRADVSTELHLYAGAVHGFDMFADCAVVRCATRESADWLARQFR